VVNGFREAGARVHDGVARLHDGVAKIHDGVAKIHDGGADLRALVGSVALYDSTNSCALARRLV